MFFTSLTSLAGCHYWHKAAKKEFACTIYLWFMWWKNTKACKSASLWTRTNICTGICLLVLKWLVLMEWWVTCYILIFCYLFFTLWFFLLVIAGGHIYFCRIRCFWGTICVAHQPQVFEYNKRFLRKKEWLIVIWHYEHEGNPWTN